jgi:hypothetical protein
MTIGRLCDCDSLLPHGIVLVECHLRVKRHNSYPSLLSNFPVIITPWIVGLTDVEF